MRSVTIEWEEIHECGHIVLQRIFLKPNETLTMKLNRNRPNVLSASFGQDTISSSSHRILSEEEVSEYNKLYYREF